MGPPFQIFMRIIYWLQFTAVGLVAVILIYSTYSGITSGITDGKSHTVLANAKTIAQGLKYFYDDQNRYPSREEFSDLNLMRSYITGYPPLAIAGGACLENAELGGFDYYSLDFKTYELRFCLPGAIDNFKPGINSVKSK